MNKERFSGVFPMGSHLCREPMPSMSEMKKDMENLKNHGFNLVKLQENWAVDEPLEGCCDFSKYEELIDYAAKLDMGVYLGLTCEQAPNWLWRKYPDARMVGVNGLPIAYQAQSTNPADGKPGPCYDHPGALRDMLKFIKKLVKVLGRYDNIVVWNTWQEIEYWPEMLAGQQVCFCENTLAHFRDWLKEKHGDLDGLNRAWNTRYKDWEYVLPERGVTRRVCLPQEIEWKYFMNNIQIGRILKNRAEAIREADPLKRPVFAHKASPIIGSGADWTYAGCQDFLGSSTYPAWHPGHAWDDLRNTGSSRYGRHEVLLTEMWEGMALKFDYLRSANRRGAPVWAAEFQGGPVSTAFHMGRVPSPEDIRRWMLTGIGSGVTAISFWVTRAEIAACEMNGFSLLDSEGDTTARYEEASRIGSALNKNADLFAKPTWPGAEVGIIINDMNYQLCASLDTGGDNLVYSVRGWHRILWDAGVPSDFVDTSELDEEYIENYKALILPFPLSISEEVAEKLKTYVENGGNLISEACPGRITEFGYANRGEMSPLLRELFGVRQKNFTMVREPGDGLRWSPPERTWGEYLDEAMLKGTGEFKSLGLRANVYIETFECKGGKPLIMYGSETAGAVREAGKGRAWLIGTFVGHNGTAYCDDDTRTFINVLLNECGIGPLHRGKLLLRKRVAGSREAWVFTNPTAEDLTEKIEVSGWTEVEDLLGDKLQKEVDHVSLEVKSLDVRVLILNR